MRRTVLAVAVTFVALTAAFAATRARRLAARVDTFAVDVGGNASAAPQVGDDAPEGPSHWAVVSPVRGDDGALGAAMAALARRGDVDFVVLQGDVLRAGDDAEGRRLAAAFRDRGIPVLAVPGPGDRAHLGTFQRWISPSRWEFTCKGSSFVSDAFAPDATTAAAQRLRVEVRATRSKGSEEIEIAAPGIGGVWRRLALDVIAPLVRTTAGYVAFLAACVVAAAAALSALRRVRPAAPPGTAARTAS
jgi:hypothetical protein